MPIKVKQNLHRIFLKMKYICNDGHKAMTQDIRPLKVLVLNLMPTKIVTEKLRFLENYLILHFR